MTEQQAYGKLQDALSSFEIIIENGFYSAEEIKHEVCVRLDLEEEE